MRKVIYNAKVYRRRGLFAEAVLIEDRRITAVGTSREILSAAPAGTEKIDAQGGTLIPGFQDCHLHLYHTALRLQAIDGTGITSIEALIERGRETIARLKPPAGTVVSGAGVNNDAFTAGPRCPTRYDLDKISTAHGIIISRVCGHLVFCNSKALEMAGIADSAPDIEGGQIHRDETGKPNGIVSENAAALVRRIIPPPSEDELQAALEYAMTRAVTHGLTGAGSFDVFGPEFAAVANAFTRIYENRGSRLRVIMQCGIAGEERYLDELIHRGLTTGQFLYGDYLKMGPVKLFADGSLGSRTAWLRKPYQDAETIGVPALETPVLRALIQKADAQGLQVAVHAIGDAAVDAVVSAYEALTTAGTRAGPNPLRHALIHCQITDRLLLERMKQQDILALVQPIFLANDLYIAESRVGRALASTSYAWGTMEKLGIHAAYGTDCPVESINPLEGIACAVTRKNASADYPKGGFFPEERVDVYTAVDNYTAGTAYANFDEHRTGRIAPGYLADLTLLDRDIFTLQAEEIPSARVLLTMIGGEAAYSA
ncbi:amidohydrolase [Spirochaetia bacterium]|nr:amidohydrolase [Spirochaetia bacterium]